MRPDDDNLPERIEQTRRDFIDIRDCLRVSIAEAQAICEQLRALQGMEEIRPDAWTPPAGSP